MSLIEEKNLKVIVFSGKQEDWKFWEVKFLARAWRKGFRDSCLELWQFGRIQKNFDLNKVDEKAKSEICDKNELAFEELVLSINTSKEDGRVAFQAVCCCKLDDYKNWSMADAWKHLSAKYVPNMALIKLELKSKFQKTKLQDASKDPDVWISNLESIHARLKDLSTDISDKDFIIHVQNGLLAKYKVQVSKLEERFSSTTNPLTIQDMRNKLNLKFAWLEHLTMEKTKANQALAAFRRYKGNNT